MPSNWELAGFGRYTHGKHWWRPSESAIYRTRFLVPGRFARHRAELVFEGVMTDALVEVNGTAAGAEHRGGFYRFRYDVGELLRYGEDNHLAVRVRKHSADRSVNRAERDADYWVFGGIYRPVYLEASPSEGIDRLAVDARHDGTLRVQVFLHRRADPARFGPDRRDPGGRLEARIETLDGRPGDLVSPKDPVVLSTRNVSLGAYTGASLHILAGGSVTTGEMEGGRLS